MTETNLEPLYLTAEQIAAVAYKAGFRGTALEIAVAVCFGESDGDAHQMTYGSSYNPPYRGVDRGLWQISSAAHPDYSTEDCMDPQKNAGFAWIISSKGTNWRPWVAYTNGSYKVFIQKAQVGIWSFLHPLPPEIQQIKVSEFQLGIKNSAKVKTGQAALNKVCGSSIVVDGWYGAQTQKQYDLFRRDKLKLSNYTGTPGFYSFDLLGKLSGLFRAVNG